MVLHPRSTPGTPAILIAWLPRGSIDYRPPPAQHQTEEAVMATSHVPHHQFRPRLPAPLPSCALSRPLRTQQDFRTGEGAHVL